MKSILAGTFASLAFVVACAAGSSASAQTAAPAGCTLAQAAGSYGLTDNGTVIGVGPRAAIALLTLDTAGNATGKVTASSNGTVSRTMLTGTYTVNSDCTGNMAFTEIDQSGNATMTASLDIVWDNDMRQFRFLFTSASQATGVGAPISTVISGKAVKLRSIKE